MHLLRQLFPKLLNRMATLIVVTYLTRRHQVIDVVAVILRDVSKELRNIPQILNDGRKQTFRNDVVYLHTLK